MSYKQHLVCSAAHPQRGFAIATLERKTQQSWGSSIDTGICCCPCRLTEECSLAVLVITLIAQYSVHTNKGYIKLHYGSDKFALLSGKDFLPHRHDFSVAYVDLFILIYD